MAIKYVKGDIFSSDCKVLVNPINCVGVMGAGLASVFKQKYPVMFQHYKHNCENGFIRPGTLYYYEVNEDRAVLNFPTKDGWQYSSKLEFIELGLDHLVDNIKNGNFTFKSIAFPKLGCGLGGLDWDEVKPLIEQRLGDLDIDVEIYV